MKVCLAVLGNDTSKREIMNSDFYQADTYCIYDLDTTETTYFVKSENGMNYLSINKLKELGIEVVITPNLRPMARRILFEAEIDVYKSCGTFVEENINLYKREKLNAFNDEMIENKSSCSSSSCSSCSSTECR